MVCAHCKNEWTENVIGGFEYDTKKNVLQKQKHGKKLQSRSFRKTT
jgi:hypothetical protein